MLLNSTSITLFCCFHFHRLRFSGWITWWCMVEFLAKRSGKLFPLLRLLFVRRPPIVLVINYNLLPTPDLFTRPFQFFHFHFCPCPPHSTQFGIQFTPWSVKWAAIYGHIHFLVILSTHTTTPSSRLWAVIQFRTLLVETAARKGTTPHPSGDNCSNYTNWLFLWFMFRVVLFVEGGRMELLRMQIHGQLTVPWTGVCFLLSFRGF